MKPNSISVGLAVHARTIATTWHLNFRRAWLWTGLLAFAAIAFGPQPAHAAMTEAWVQRYGSEAGSEDEARHIVTDAAGNVIVAGTTDGGSDMLIIKYSGAGVPLWTNRCDGYGGAIAVDGSGNVFVTGGSYGSEGNLDYATIAYSGAGVALWTNRYNGPGNYDEFAIAIAVDGGGNVFVTGSSGRDYATVAYSGAGVPLWTNLYKGPDSFTEQPSAIAVDGSGNVFVTGYSRFIDANQDYYYAYATVAYSGAGVPLWTNRYKGSVNGYLDQATAIAVDGSGNVFVTGTSIASGSSFDYATIKYSGAGLPLWTNRFNGPQNSYDHANAVAVDVSGNVFVTGDSAGTGGNPDFATIAYSGAGVPLWTNRYSGGSLHANALAVDRNGNVFVTGSVGDYATIAYSGAGVPLWTNRYNGPQNGWDQATAVAVNASGDVFVTGSSLGIGGNPDYATIAYSGAGLALWTNRYGGPGAASNVANAAAVDASGNVFVTGYSYGTPGYEDYATIAYSSAGVLLWTNRYDGPATGSDQATAVAVDASGNVFVTGSSYGSGGDDDYATIAYSGAGAPLWTNRYDGPQNGWDRATAVAVDASGNVFVTGASHSDSPVFGFADDYATIAYSGAGVPLWTNRYDGPGNFDDRAIAIAVDASGNVFVTGTSYGSGGYEDYATIAYSGAGVPLWTNRYDGPGNIDDRAIAIAVDGSGNVFVTGTSRFPFGDYATIAYSGAGIPLWTNLYAGQARALAVDGSGNVIVTGWSGYRCTDLGCGGGGYATIAYSGAGVPLWTNLYAGPAYSENQPSAVAVDGSGNVFVTGTSGTIAYSGAGVPLCTNRYNGTGKPSLAIGSDDAVYVTTSAGLSLPDFATVKYVWRPEIAIQLLPTIPPSVNLTLSGAPYAWCAIEWAPELTGPWSTLTPLQIGPNGSAQFQDSNAPSPAGFYRARPAHPPKGA